MVYSTAIVWNQNFITAALWWSFECGHGGLCGGWDGNVYGGGVSVVMDV